MCEDLSSAVFFSDSVLSDSVGDVPDHRIIFDESQRKVCYLITIAECLCGIVLTLLDQLRL